MPRTYDPKDQVCAMRLLFGLASGGVFHAVSVTGNAVRSYRTFSPFPASEKAGSFFSVALSFESPQPDVIRHPFPLKPGLSSPSLEANTITL